MSELPCVDRVVDIRLGAYPAFDAWFYTFRAENNIEHHINPAGVAGEEQLGFMVTLDEKQIYVPCSDATFRELVESHRARRLSPSILRQYGNVWRIITNLVRVRLADPLRRRDMLNYCRHRFQGSLALGCILPSRLVKRLITTVINQLEGNDPWADDRVGQNRRTADFMNALPVRTALSRLPDACARCKTLPAMRDALDHTLLARLLYLAGHSPQTFEALAQQIPTDFATTLPTQADAFTDRMDALVGARDEGTRTFLYLCDTDGGLIFDLHVIRALLQQGHKVVLAIKESPVFMAPIMDDMAHDALLVEGFASSYALRDPAVTKNELLRRLREHRLLIISDGTSERLNLYRTSITFARAWKECDAVLAKGRRNKQVLLDTSTQFTRDVFCFWEERGQVRMELRPHAPGVRKFSEIDLSTKAGGIITSMRKARDAGKAVMFYSCIIGSIPGQTHVAIEVAETFVRHLRGILDHVLVINPAEYFEEGMDGDDLMFMWEQVQRSGLINIWRFQSMEDVETSFSLLGRKVPPSWSGKDATFSTGCTKEMRIALDMQRSHPELQLIGPAAEKFFRRANYGVGKYFDATINHQDMPR